MYIRWDLKTSNYKTEQKIGRLAKMHFFGELQNMIKVLKRPLL